MLGQDELSWYDIIYVEKWTKNWIIGNGKCEFSNMN